MDDPEAQEALSRMQDDLGITENEIRTYSPQTFRAVFGFWQFGTPTERQTQVLNAYRPKYRR